MYLLPVLCRPQAKICTLRNDTQPVLWVIAALGVAAVVLTSLGLLSDKQEVPS